MWRCATNGPARRTSLTCCVVLLLLSDEPSGLSTAGNVPYRIRTTTGPSGKHDKAEGNQSTATTTGQGRKGAPQRHSHDRHPWPQNRHPGATKPVQTPSSSVLLLVAVCRRPWNSFPRSLAGKGGAPLPPLCQGPALPSCSLGRPPPRTTPTDQPAFPLACPAFLRRHAAGCGA